MSSDEFYKEVKADVDEAFTELSFTATLKKTDSAGNVSSHTVTLVRAGEPERKDEMNVPVGDVEYLMKHEGTNPRRTDIIEFADGEKEVIMRATPIKPANITIAWTLITSYQ